MNVKTLPNELVSIMLDADYSATEVASMYMCACGAPKGIALYKISGSSLMVCDECNYWS